jgi:hypothetical protein
MREAIETVNNRTLSQLSGAELNLVDTSAPLESNETIVFGNPDFPGDSLVSVGHLRLYPGKPSVSDDFLPK